MKFLLALSIGRMTPLDACPPPERQKEGEKRNKSRNQMIKIIIDKK
jgi:hypothetical protein